MRLSYKINDKDCYFHFVNRDIYHEVSSLLSLLNITPDLGGRDKNEGLTFVYMPDAEPRTNYKVVNYQQCIHENQLIPFLGTALGINKNRLYPTPEKLSERIQDKRFDSIVKMYTHHLSFSHSQQGKKTATPIGLLYSCAYASTDLYVMRRGLTDIGTLQWLKTKTILPRDCKNISDERLFTLLTLISPFWSSQAPPVNNRYIARIAHATICEVMEVFRSPEVNSRMKAEKLSSAIIKINSEIPKYKDEIDQSPTP